MGVFDVTCSASGIVLDGRARLLFLIDGDRGHLPCLPPLQGIYDRYGKIEDVRAGAARAAAERLAKKLEHDDLEELFGAAFEPGVSVAKGTLRYALVDELVYRSIVATVASGALPHVEPDLESALEALDFPKLVAAALDSPDFALPLLKGHERDPVLRHELVALALFRKMPLALAATTPDSPSGQYLYFHERVAKKHGEPAAESETRKAERAFASYPLVLAAIAENERSWIEREKGNLEGDGGDGDDDDDDDATYTVELKAPRGHTIPPLLRDFGQWLKARRYGAVGYFELLAGTPTYGEPNADKRLRDAMSFVHLPEGSLVVLVKHGDGPPPVALVGSEGALRTLAGSLEEFLTNLAAGDTGVMELDDEDATDREKLSDFLKSKKVVVPKAPDFDFQAWLDGVSQAEARPASAPRAIEPRLVEGLPGFFAELASMMGRRADDPELVAFLQERLGKKPPAAASDDGSNIYVINKSVGVELLFSHEILNEKYPLVQKSARSFVPYLSYAWLRKKLPDGLPFGLEFGDGKRGTPWKGKRTIDAARDIVLDLEIFKPGDCAVLYVEHGRDIVNRHGLTGMRVTLGVFIAWALSRNLLDKGRFAGHEATLDAIEKRRAQGSALISALERGFWDRHLKDLEGLRSFAVRNFEELEGDLIAVFGKRKGAPKLDDDTWDAVDAVAERLDARFAKWVR